MGSSSVIEAGSHVLTSELSRQPPPAPEAMTFTAPTARVIQTHGNAENLQCEHSGSAEIDELSNAATSPACVREGIRSVGLSRRTTGQWPRAERRESESRSHIRQPDPITGQPPDCRELAAILVPKKGLEPPHPCGYMDLNHARLPIPPLRHICPARSRWTAATASVTKASTRVKLWRPYASHGIFIQERLLS